jgi:ABC-type nitrate/sulfonate/bicarbonate transport system substrate-binding protein
VGFRAEWTRRQLVGGAVGATLVTSSCPWAIAAPTEFFVQLNWIFDAEYGGTYVALERDYFHREDISPKLIPGGPSVAVLPSVAAGRALLGISSPDLIASANAQGAQLCIIAAVYQRNPFCVLSLARKPIPSPVDLRGMRIGIPVNDTSMWTAFLRINGLSERDVTAIPVQWSLEPLLRGEVDGWLAYAINEPIVLQTQGVDSRFFLLHDFGYPMLQQVYVVRRDSLSNPTERSLLTSFLRAEIRGWQVAIEQPGLVVELTISKFGRDLKLDQVHQRLLAEQQVAFVQTRESKEIGLLTMSRAAIEQSLSSLRNAKFQVSNQLFETSLIEEAYGGLNRLE